MREARRQRAAAHIAAIAEQFRTPHAPGSMSTDELLAMREQVRLDVEGRQLSLPMSSTKKASSS